MDEYAFPPTPEQSPLQLRIGFTAPTRALAMELRLTGLTVVVEADDLELAAAHLAAVGVQATRDDVRGLLFPVRELSRVVALPSQVQCRGEGPMAALLEIVDHPPAVDTPIRIDRDPTGDLLLVWTDGSVRRETVIPSSAGPAVTSLGLSHVASADVWPVLSGSLVPLPAGSARVNLDRYVEITAVSPQRVESSPLPALWRIDGTHYGLPLSYADALDKVGGFTWQSAKPVLDAPPRDLVEPGFPLSPHVAADLRTLVDGLSRDRARAIVWREGLGRRMFALAAVECLNSYPLLVVCGPWALWPWRRNLALIGRDGEDAQVVTYEELRFWRGEQPSAVIYDDLNRFCDEVATPGSPLRRFDASLDLVRIAVAPGLPEGPDAVCSFMSVLRPAEFDPSVPTALRYPGDPVRRSREHAGAYISVRSQPAHGRTSFRRSTVELIDVPDRLRVALETAPDQGQIISSGSADVLSPKLARAAEMVTTSKVRRIVVATSSERSARLLESLLLPLRAARLHAGQIPTDGVSIARFGGDIPLGRFHLQGVDEVIVLDWPDDSREIDLAVGGPDSGPARVVVLHLAGTIDDRAALYSNNW